MSDQDSAINHFVSGVGFSGNTPGSSADYRNEKSEAITCASGIGAQKIDDSITNTNNLDFFWLGWAAPIIC